MKFCPNCGNELGISAKFCASCGYVLADYTAPGQAAAKEPVKNVFEDFGKKDRNVFEDIGVKEPKYSDYSQTTRSASAEPEYETSYSYEDDDSYHKETNVYAIASLVLSLLAIPFNLFLFIPGALAIIFGIVGLKRSNETGTGHTIAMTGLILGIVVTAGYLLLLISAVLFVGIAAFS